ncbi:PIG-L deacetylase family protein [Flexivirga meconopsidis]|uniref:PIG-L deacetylase family protein n=1 Tax=Flexivirga meconopsidis TaxID=2977121 RepID=UPI002240E0DB
MSTIVFFHAHPDDEASQTAGAMAKASDEGHRVVVVYATGGEHGEVPDDLAPGETLRDRRRAEAEQSARATGTARVAWLGYHDSGMTGWEQNAAPDSFHCAPVDEAATRLAAILDDERADVLIGYDWHGNYGHPDHVKVHAVTYRATELAARSPRVLEETANRDALRAAVQAAKAAGLDLPFDPDGPMDDGNPMGTPEAEIHWAVDVSDYLDRIRASMEAHRSQVSDIGGFMSMPKEVFDGSFGTEYFVERGRPAGMVHGWFLDDANA